ncbi:MAG: phosphoribosylformylglycinamidine cyclo-ligase [Actinobacteria bacterium]|nr:MAG: phosphoribosylformylglycinamidine cyclo-ligase [Actinomycetota bacterium]TMK93871.1 MAG: phosphoribosylformylglycinamidine cyclo-ligase [Actinomycetota bacterium]TMM21196.1 MAG: phosphoribosylformylglycinamidine cyclo-ligase [Actinomycetota bacterium]
MSEAYRSSGVDTEAAAKAVTLIADLAAQARRPEVAGEVGGFAGLFSIGGGRLLAAATDGVGTKLEFARITGRLDTVGIDLVAMCADDVVCTGAEPLFFLDYLAVGRVVPDDVASVVEGIVEGCRLAGCALLGGETAEHPGVMADDRFDLAGFCVGIVDGEQVLGPERVRPGDALIGLPSSGLHANGFSLVRTVVTSDELAIAPPALGRTFADEVLAPCRIYAPEVLALHRDRLVHAAAHITGGGFLENVPRVLPAGLGARIERGAWTEPPIFEEIRRRAAATDADMFGTFNMGIGMVLVVGPDEVGTVLTRAAGSIRIGEVVPGSGVRID